MNAIGFRRIVLKLDGAEEHEHMGHPDFRVGGRIFATLHAGYRTGAIMLAPEQQQDLVRDHPSAFAPANGAWGWKGATVVTLSHVNEETLGEALTLAWQRAVALGPTRSAEERSAKASRSNARIRKTRSPRRPSGR